MWSTLNQLRFQSPVFLLLFVPLLILVWVRCRTVGPTVVYSSTDLVSNLPVTLRQRLRSLLPWLQVMAAILLILALARPQSADEKNRVRTEGIAIQMCIDRSGSMQAMDFPVDGERVDRLTAVKKVFREFVAGDAQFTGRPNDLIGLVTFGGFATAVCPPTLDHSMVLTVLESVEIPDRITDENGRVINEQLLQEEQATAIGDALALAVERIRGVEAKSRIIVFLSDGANTAGVIDPEDAIAAAKQFGIKVYTIGIGTDGMAPFPMIDPFGKTVLQLRRVQLDQQMLTRIAEQTSGRYFHAQDTDTLADVYAEIDQLERSEIEGSVYRHYQELYWWPLIVGAAIWLLATVLGETMLKTIP